MSSNVTGAGSRSDETYDVVVLGAGYAGLMATLRMTRREPGLRIALVGARDRFVERVRLQEGIVNDVPARIPSIADFLRRSPVDFICGRVLALDVNRRCVRIAAADGGERSVSFGHCVFALGSDIDVDGIRGASEHAYRLAVEDGARSGEALRSKLQAQGDGSSRVVVVGGAETGVEAAGEIKTNWPATQVSIVSRGRCGDFRGPRVERNVRAALVKLGVTLIDNELVAEVGPTQIITASGRSIRCDLCVWSGGLRSAPIAREAAMATDEHGRVLVDASLRSISHPHILAAGDAARPVAPTGAPYRQSAFAALVSGAYAADVILASKSGKQLPPFSFSTFGQGVAIGRGGVGFFSYPDDEQRGLIVKGRVARHIRNFFVWLVCNILVMERRYPGSFFWLGRGRVSWQQANDAISRLRVHEPQKSPGLVAGQ